MVDLDIARLAITFEGQPHRAGPISARAAEILAVLVGRRLAGTVLADDVRLDRLSVPPLHIDLSLTGDEEVAARVAAAVDGALAAALKI
jgi:hypothetical protein